MYGLGSLVKKAVKGVTGAVKKIAGSGLGKAALLGFGANALIPGGLGSLFGGGGGLTGILSKGKSLLGGLSAGQRFAGSLGLAALASAPQEVQEESSRDVGALRKYLTSYYQNLGYSADEIAENVERDTAEYTSGAGGYAEGGRIGYREGSLANYPLRTMGGGPTPQQTLPDGTPYNPGFPAPGRQPGGNQNSGITTLSDGTVYNPGRPAPGSNVGLGYDKPMPQGIQPPGELAYDATNTSIYGSSAASFSPKTIMNQSGNQVQAGFGKTPGMQPGGLTLNPGATIDPNLINDRPRPGGGLTLNPGATIDPNLINDRPRPGGGLTLNPGATIDPNLINDRPRPGGGGRPIGGGPSPYAGPIKSQNDYFANQKLAPGADMDKIYQDYVQKHQDYNAGQQPFPFMGKGGPEAFDNFSNRITDMRDRTLKPGIVAGNLASYANNGQLPIGQPQPISGERMDALNRSVVGNGIYDMLNQPPQLLQNTRIMPATPVPFQEAQAMPFAQQANSSSPMAQIAGMADGGRIGYNEGTPEMGMIDPNKAKQAKQMIGMGADQDLISTITGLTKEQVQFLMTENKADGGRIGYAMGDTAEQNAIQASGIMNLPLNKNPAGITELDLRETGGFIPPVGVKEKEDDIPAMLSNNEFVFTADAVRGMGDGNVNKGAQRMYDMMKKLEKGGRV
jgi:hypothetical protein